MECVLKFSLGLHELEFTNIGKLAKVGSEILWDIRIYRYNRLHSIHYP
jgi:hypothetical protein